MSQNQKWLFLVATKNITGFRVQRNTMESKFDLPSLSQTVNFKAK